MQIAVDGPAGAGKSTVAKMLARRLNYIYVDTGAMYRAVTLAALEAGLELEDSGALVALARACDLNFEVMDDEQRVWCDGVDVSAAIRSPRVSSRVAQLAAQPALRAVMVAKQQAIARERDVIMDGRDIGEIVLPQADYKFFITADLKTRCRRRALELSSQGYAVDESALERDMAERDRMDEERAVGALKRLPDAIVINTDDLTIDEVLECMLNEMGKV